jgi:hypothetical protein
LISGTAIQKLFVDAFIDPKYLLAGNRCLSSPLFKVSAATKQFGS